MIRGLNHYLFRVPVQAGEIVDVMDKGQRLKIRKVDGGTVEIGLTRGSASLHRPNKGDYLVEYPKGHIEVMSPEQFAAKACAGVSEHGA